MKLVVTGATGFLGSRAAELLRDRGHDIVALARPGGRERALTGDVVRIDAGDPAARAIVVGSDAVLHFAGVPDPASAAADPAAAVRANVGTTLNLLEAGTALVYPSTVRAAIVPPPDEYALSKRLGELACELHPTRATVLRLTSVFGPGQVAWEGATGAVAAFAARALDGDPITIPGDPERTRDFVYVDDVVDAVERIVVRNVAAEQRELEPAPGSASQAVCELVRLGRGFEQRDGGGASRHTR